MERRFTEVRVCCSCGDFNRGLPTMGPCPTCGHQGVCSAATWKSRTGHITSRALPHVRWWKPWTWLDRENVLISPDGDVENQQDLKDLNR